MHSIFWLVSGKVSPQASTGLRGTCQADDLKTEVKSAVHWDEKFDNNLKMLQEYKRNHGRFGTVQNWIWWELFESERNDHCIIIITMLRFSRTCMPAAEGGKAWSLAQRLARKKCHEQAFKRKSSRGKFKIRNCLALQSRLLTCCAAEAGGGGV